MTQIIKPVRTAGRFGAAGAVSLGITMGLFLIMQMLVGEQELELLPEVPPVKVDFWMEDKPMEVERDPRPTKPEVPPSPPMVITTVDPVGPQVGPTYNPPAIGPEVGPDLP